MEIKPVKIDIKCDTHGCKNIADYVIQKKKGIIATNMYFCKECLSELYKSIGSVIVPKSPKNMFKKEK